MISAHELVLRRLKDNPEDYAQLSRWLSNPTLLEFYEGRNHLYTPELVAATFNPKVMQADGEIPCLILFDEVPFGYLQYYEVQSQTRLDWDLPENRTIYGLDLFIGETSLWNQGLGSQTVLLALAYLFEKLNADWVILDPQISNERAIYCYEKCGFKKLRLLPEHEMHEGSLRDCWLMGIDINQYHHLPGNIPRLQSSS